jgi:hypothetical protein
MARELDIIGEASIGGWMRWRHKHIPPIGTPCANCETPLQGAFCYNCGQLAEGFHRSIGHLIVEVFESFFHFDGRLWQTIPKLAIKPGVLTREYLDGKRALQIPPLRMFLVVLLVFFFVGGLTFSNEQLSKAVNVQTTPSGPVTASQRAQLIQAWAAKNKLRAAFHKKPLPLPTNLRTVPAAPAAPTLAVKSAAASAGDATAAAAADQNLNISLGPRDHEKKGAFENWMETKAKLAMQNRKAFGREIADQAHNYAFMLLPISALFLSLLFVFQRRFFIFDHLVFSMHSLSAQGLLLSVIILVNNLGLPGGWLVLASPVHLFVHMRGAYQTSIFGTLLRMFLLSILTVIAVSILSVVMIATSLSALDG